ncbi:hypothetical protein P7C71_g1708, partial [Lecanoromycetidae sp. Uapishka_2]
MLKPELIQTPHINDHHRFQNLLLSLETTIYDTLQSIQYHSPDTVRVLPGTISDQLHTTNLHTLLVKEMIGCDQKAKREGPFTICEWMENLETNVEIMLVAQKLGECRAKLRVENLSAEPYLREFAKWTPWMNQRATDNYGMLVKMKEEMRKC